MTNGGMRSGSRGQAHSGQRGGSSYTRTRRSQNGQSASIKGGPAMASVMSARCRWGERSLPGSDGWEGPLIRPLVLGRDPPSGAIPPERRSPPRVVRGGLLHRRGGEGPGSRPAGGSGCLALAPSPLEVGTDGFVLPTQGGLVVHGQPRAASDLGADPVSGVDPVLPRQLPNPIAS